MNETLTKSNPDYDIVIKRLHLYYDMKLVTFRIDKDRNLIIQFPIFVQPYTQQPLILYQLETVKGHAAPYFPTQPQPKHKHTLEKTRTRWSNQRHRFNLVKMEQYNTQDSEMTDFNEIDIVEPTPK